jgi:hypothetical protein
LGNAVLAVLNAENDYTYLRTVSGFFLLQEKAAEKMFVDMKVSRKL